MTPYTHQELIDRLSFDRVIGAANAERIRLQRTVQILSLAQLPFAIAGDHAIGHWIRQIDESAVRNPVDVDLVIRRSDFEQVRSELESAGFLYRETDGYLHFVEHKQVKRRRGIQLFIVNEQNKPHLILPVPDFSEADLSTEMRFLSLEKIVHILLIAFRNLEGMLLRDILGVGLIDQAWPAKYTPMLAARLQTILDDPDG
jgi:hypothetical protein